jgi:predicted alpha/beta hydrolase family esterase
MIYIHGNGTEHWPYGWAPWLKSELEKLGFSTFFETFPDSIIARAEYWLPFLKDHIKAGPDDVLIGWSSGAVASMRYAEANKIRGSVLIAPCYTDIGDEHERQGGYYETPWNWEAIKSNQDKIALFCSDNDPYIPQDQFEFISEKIGAEMIKIPGAGHFIGRETFPELLEYIQKTYL